MSTAASERKPASPVLIAAGGTGGHVIPALAVAEELHRRAVPVVWVGTQAGLEARLVPAADIEIHWITVAGLRGKGPLAMLTGVGKLILACLQAIVLLGRLRPGAVLGMGGFVSGPVGLAAWLTRRPLVLHEQNAVAGTTNRYLARLATRVFSAMPDVFPAQVGASAIGNPVRRRLIDAALLSPATRAANEPLHILVVGGSRGAHALNTVVPAAVACFATPCQVLHQTGEADLQMVRDAYAQLGDSGCEGEASAFIDDMPAAYARADVVICRSGAMTVTELCAMRAAAILVPFPHAVDDHQTRNAEFLSQAGAAVLMPQSSLSATALGALLVELDQHRERLSTMRELAGGLFQPAASEVVADALLEVAA